MRTLFSTSSALLLFAATSHASGGEAVPFPLARNGAGDALAGVELVLRADELAPLLAKTRVTWSAVPLADGSEVTLEAERLDLVCAPDAIRVDGEIARTSGANDLSCWSARIANEPDSSAFLALSAHGSRGWIRRGTEIHHLLAGPGAGGDWSRSVTQLVSESSLQALGATTPPGCGNDLLAPTTPITPTSLPTTSALATTSTLLCRMAIETDYQLFQKFNNLAAEQVYLQSLLAAASARFVEQLGVRLEIAYLGLHASSNDGWVSGDTGAGSGAMLDEFRIAWTNDVPNGAHLAHFLSGAGLGGGVAYLDVLCNDDWGFAVSGDLSGHMPFPVFQGPLSWDFFVFTHETGHNFGSPHTQDFCPPLDLCVASCASTTQCTNQGTIMSYCHGCPGGMNNITLYLHTACADLMRAKAEASCLPEWCAPATSFCTVNPNSFSPSGAKLVTAGTSFVSHNDLVLIAIGVPPGANGLFVCGTNDALAPFGNGWLCVAPPLVRLGVATGDFVGDASFDLDLDALPAGSTIGAGDTRLFQFWFRDPAGGGAGFNLSDGLSVGFCP